MSEENHEAGTVLKCSTPITATLQLPAASGTVYTAASLKLDISRFCSPCIYFEFAGDIITTEVMVHIDFQLFELCGDQTVPVAVSPVWKYSTGLPTTSGGVFFFKVCRCGECKENCCNFNVRAIITGGGATAGDVSIRNSTLSALVTENDCHN